MTRGRANRRRDLEFIPRSVQDGTTLTTISDPVPLCVDLDGTVIRTDLVWESLVRLLRRNPLYLVALPFWWLRGRAWLKRQMAARTRVDVATLPYHETFLEFLQSERQRGRHVCLVTAADDRWAGAVAAHLGLFTEVLASDGRTNLRGSVKAARLVERFGERGFDYAGNSPADLPVWARARQALVISDSPGLAARAGAARHGQPGLPLAPLLVECRGPSPAPPSMGEESHPVCALDYGARNQPAGLGAQGARGLCRVSASAPRAPIS